MDQNDIRIIKLLQENARITVSDISSQINLSVSAVSERLKKLESSGIIQQYTAIINPKKLSKSLTAFMFVSLERPKYIEKFLETVNNQNDILESYYLAGDFDYFLKIVTENTESLEKLLNSIKSIQGVQKTKTIVALSNVKMNFSVSPDESEA